MDFFLKLPYYSCFSEFEIDSFFILTKVFRALQSVVAVAFISLKIH